MILAALDVSSKNLITIAVLAVLFIALYLFSRFGKSESDHRADRLQAQYKVMTDDLLASLSDEELTEAVVANVLAKQDRRRPDLYTDLPLQTPGRCAVVSSWLVDRELDAADFETLFASPSGILAELAADGLDRLGAVDCAAAVRKGLAAETDEVRAESHADYVEARAREQLPQKWVTYIRENAGEFLDNRQED